MKTALPHWVLEHNQYDFVSCKSLRVSFDNVSGTVNLQNVWLAAEIESW